MNFDKFECKIENLQTKDNVMNSLSLSYHENLLTSNSENRSESRLHLQYKSAFILPKCRKCYFVCISFWMGILTNFQTPCSTLHIPCCLPAILT